MTVKIDPKRTLDCYRARVGEFRTLKVPPMQYLTVDGHGDPNTSREYADAVGALYPASYAVKFASKGDLGRDYVVPPLEALWWAPDMEVFTTARDKTAWSWTVMLMVPEWVPAAMVDDALASVGARKKPRALEKVRLEPLDEGLCVQTLHVGPYDAEAELLADLHDRLIPDSGLQMTGKHHEVYLSDPRRTAPAKLRTILRQPVEQAAHQ